jgi:hypothetical protein
LPSTNDGPPRLVAEQQVQLVAELQLRIDQFAALLPAHVLHKQVQGPRGRGLASRAGQHLAHGAGAEHCGVHQKKGERLEKREEAAKLPQKKLFPSFASPKAAKDYVNLTFLSLKD